MRKITLCLQVCLLPLLVFTQTPTIDWTYNIGAPAFGSAAAADLDGDGKLEIVFSTYTNDGRVHCLNGEDGSMRWIYDIGGCGDVAPIIYDVDGDDTLDVIVNGSCNPTIFCINGNTGAMKWSKPSGGGDSPPTIEDIDGDLKPEILFGNFSGEVRVLNGEDGSTAKIIPVDNNPIQTEPSLIDVNFDGQLDIVVANYINDDGYHIYAIDYNTTAIHWQRDDTSSSSFHAYHAGAVADIDQDDTLEYVVGRNNGSIIAVNVEDGSELWTVTGLTNVIGALTIADLDHDSIPEVIYSNNDYINFNDHIGVLSGDNGNLEWSYPTTFSSFRGCSVTDLDNDGQLDLVSGHFMSRVRAVEPYNGLLWEINLHQQLPNSGLLPYSEADHQPLIADFDDDGRLEAFTVAGYGTYTPDSLNTGVAFLLDGGTGSYCPEWLMFRQDAHRTGYLSAQDEAESCDTVMVSIPEPAQAEWTLYPNPSAGQLTLRGTVTAADPVTLRIVDMRGAVLHTQQIEAPADGQVQLPLTRQLSTLPDGIYGVQLRTRSTAQFFPVVLQR